jgi:hypothetical protein
MEVKTGMETGGMLKNGEKNKQALFTCRIIFFGKKNSSFTEKGSISHFIILTLLFVLKFSRFSLSPINRKLLLV